MERWLMHRTVEGLSCFSRVLVFTFKSLRGLSTLYSYSDAIGLLCSDFCSSHCFKANVTADHGTRDTTHFKLYICHTMSYTESNYGSVLLTVTLHGHLLCVFCSECCVLIYVVETYSPSKSPNRGMPEVAHK